MDNLLLIVLSAVAGVIVIVMSLQLITLSEIDARKQGYMSLVWVILAIVVVFAGGFFVVRILPQLVGVTP